MPIVTKSNKPNGYVVFSTSATDGFKLNHATLPSANAAGETVAEMSISEVMWSVNGTNRWTVTRGANTVAVLSGSGNHDYQSSGMSLEHYLGDRQANVIFALSGGTGTVVAKFHKKSGE